MNPNESIINFQFKWIKINLSSDWFSNRKNHCSNWFGLKIRFRSIQVQIDSDSFRFKIYFRFIRIEVSDWVGVIFQRFSSNKVRNCFRIGCDWFALARMQISAEWFGIVLLGSEWILIRNFRRGYFPFSGFSSSISSLGESFESELIRTNQNYSESFWYLYPSQCESIRINRKKVFNLVSW